MAAVVEKLRCLDVAGLVAVVSMVCATGCGRTETPPPTAKTAEPAGLTLTLENIYKRGRGGAVNPSISPNGKWVAFSAARSDNTQQRSAKLG